MRNLEEVKIAPNCLYAALPVQQVRSLFATLRLISYLVHTSSVPCSSAITTRFPTLATVPRRTCYNSGSLKEGYQMDLKKVWNVVDDEDVV